MGILSALIEFTIWRENGILKVHPIGSFWGLNVYQRYDTLASLTAIPFMKGFKTVHNHIPESSIYLLR